MDDFPTVRSKLHIGRARGMMVLRRRLAVTASLILSLVATAALFSLGTAPDLAKSSSSKQYQRQQVTVISIKPPMHHHEASSISPQIEGAPSPLLLLDRVDCIQRKNVTFLGDHPLVSSDVIFGILGSNSRWKSVGSAMRGTWLRDEVSVWFMEEQEVEDASSAPAAPRSLTMSPQREHVKNNIITPSSLDLLPWPRVDELECSTRRRNGESSSLEVSRVGRSLMVPLRDPISGKTYPPSSHIHLHRGAFKNLPAVRFFHQHTSAPFYLLADDDTFVVTVNLRHWLSSSSLLGSYSSDADGFRVPYYGGRLSTLRYKYVHGGAGILLSRKLVEMLEMPVNTTQMREQLRRHVESKRATFDSQFSTLVESAFVVKKEEGTVLDYCQRLHYAVTGGDLRLGYCVGLLAAFPHLPAVRCLPSKLFSASRLEDETAGVTMGPIISFHHYRDRESIEEVWTAVQQITQQKSSSSSNRTNTKKGPSIDVRLLRQELWRNELKWVERVTTDISTQFHGVASLAKKNMDPKASRLFVLAVRACQRRQLRVNLLHQAAVGLVEVTASSAELHSFCRLRGLEGLEMGPRSPNALLFGSFMRKSFDSTHVELVNNGTNGDATNHNNHRRSRLFVMIVGTSVPGLQRAMQRSNDTWGKRVNGTVWVFHGSRLGYNALDSKSVVHIDRSRVEVGDWDRIVPQAVAYASGGSFLSITDSDTLLVTGEESIIHVDSLWSLHHLISSASRNHRIVGEETGVVFSTLNRPFGAAFLGPHSRGKTRLVRAGSRVVTVNALDSDGGAGEGASARVKKSFALVSKAHR